MNTAKMQQVVAAIGVCGLLTVALPAFAQVTVGGYTSGESKVVGVPIENPTSGSVQVGAGIHGSASGSSSNATGNASANTNTTISTGSGSAGVQTSGSSDAVMQTEAMITGDAQASVTNATPQQVELSYASHAKLFGFIPVVVPVHAQAQADGTVTVHYPWYSFLLSTNKADVEAKLQAAVGRDLASANAQAGLTTQVQATLLHDMYSVLRDSFGASASANTNASAQY